MSTQISSPSNWALQKSTDAFTVNTDNNFAIKGTKAVARISANAMITVAAIVETVVFSVLTAITLGYSISLKDHASLAANTAMNAFKGIAGYYVPAKIEAPVVEAPKAPPTKMERIKYFGSRIAAYIPTTKAKNAFDVVASKVKAHAPTKGQAAKIGLGLATAAVGGYGVYHYDLVSKTVEAIVSTKDYVVKTSYNKFQEAAGAIHNRFFA